MVKILLTVLFAFVNFVSADITYVTESGDVVHVSDIITFTQSLDRAQNGVVEASWDMVENGAAYDIWAFDLEAYEFVGWGINLHPMEDETEKMVRELAVDPGRHYFIIVAVYDKKNNPIAEKIMVVPLYVETKEYWKADDYFNGLDDNYYDNYEEYDVMERREY